MQVDGIQMHSQKTFKGVPREGVYAIFLHLILLTILVVSFDHHSLMPVLENHPNEHVMQAIVMEEAPAMPPAPPLPPHPSPTLEKPTVAAKPISKPIPALAVQQKNTIILPDKKKERTIREAMLKKEFLADLQKQKNRQQKQLRQIALQNAFAKEVQALKLQQQMKKEQQRLNAAKAHAERMSGEVNKYKALILQTIGQHWLVPPNVNKKLSAELLIRTAPGGMVLDVQLMKSSGDETLDRSARAAVFKSSPLPVPPEQEAFESFRQFVLKVKPENILANDNWLS